MPGLRGLSGLGALSGLVGVAYSRKVLQTGPIAYWPLGEASGAVAADISGNSFDGSYTGVSLGQPGIGDGNTCPLFDGVNDFVNIYSAGLAAAFDGSEGSAAIWARVYDAGTWADATIRKALLLRADVNNRIFLHKTNVNNDFRHEYRAGGTIEGQNTVGLTSTDWMHYAITWSASTDQVRSFIDGVQQGDTATGLGVWAGALSGVRTLVGANSQTPDGVWYGWLAHCAVWDSALTLAQIAHLAVI